jgi:transposase
MITAYRDPDRARGRQQMQKLIDTLSHGVPALSRRAGDVLAYFDRPGTSNGPTEAINGRLELAIPSKRVDGSVMLRTVLG